MSIHDESGAMVHEAFETPPVPSDTLLALMRCRVLITGLAAGGEPPDVEELDALLAGVESAIEANGGVRLTGKAIATAVKEETRGIHLD